MKKNIKDGKSKYYTIMNIREINSCKYEVLTESNNIYEIDFDGFLVRMLVEQLSFNFIKVNKKDIQDHILEKSKRYYKSKHRELIKEIKK